MLNVCPLLALVSVSVEVRIVAVDVGDDEGFAVGLGVGAEVGSAVGAGVGARVAVGDGCGVLVGSGVGELRGCQPRFRCQYADMNGAVSDIIMA